MSRQDILPLIKFRQLSSFRKRRGIVCLSFLTHILTTYRCGTCGNILRKWTSYRKEEERYKRGKSSETFVCQLCHPGLEASRQYPALELRNTDYNRFTCFRCDYNICDVCLDKKEKLLYEIKELKKKIYNDIVGALNDGISKNDIVI